MPKVVTANLLATGSVVFLGADDTWVGSVEDAAGFDDDKAADEALGRAQRDQERALVVEPFITERGVSHDGRAAMTLRDTIRAYGPTIRFKAAVGAG